MKFQIHTFPLVAAALSLVSIAGFAQKPAATAPYHLIKRAKVGGDGGFDYVYADADARKLYVPRSGPSARVSVFDLDTQDSVGEIAMTNARGAACDAKYGHGFASSNPVAMWDAKTLAPIKTIPVAGRPDGILNDPFNHHIYVFSHAKPNVNVIDAKDGAVLGTIDLGGAPEQAVSDGKGRIFVDIEDKDSVGVIDAKTMKVATVYSLNGKGGGNAGLAIDTKNHVLFVACREPQVMVMLDANDGKYLADLPIGRGCDGAIFNPKTMECFSSQGDGTLTVIKETAPTKFVVEQTVQTLVSAKTLTLDPKTGRIYLIAAEFGAPDDPAPQPGRFARRPMTPGSFSIVVVGK